MDDDLEQIGSQVLLDVALNGGERGAELIDQLFSPHDGPVDNKYVACIAAELYLLSGHTTPEAFRDMLVGRIESGEGGVPTDINRYALDWLREKHPEIF